MILWDDRALAGDLMVSAMIHVSGTHILSLTKYGGAEGRYFAVDLQFKAEDIDAIAALLDRMKAARGTVTVDLAIMEAC